MRHFKTKKILPSVLKYAVVNKETSTITLYRFKTHVSELINVSSRTLDRNKTYETNKYIVYKVSNVVL